MYVTRKSSKSHIISLNEARSPCEQETYLLFDFPVLSTQLIQCAKCYQTVVRLGTYTAKVPIYNSLKALPSFTYE